MVEVGDARKIEVVWVMKVFVWSLIKIHVLFLLGDLSGDRINFNLHLIGIKEVECAKFTCIQNKNLIVNK